MTQLLVEAGARVDGPGDDDSRSPIYLACMLGHTEIFGNRFAIRVI
jgi:hypothetical protein